MIQKEHFKILVHIPGEILSLNIIQVKPQNYSSIQELAEAYINTKDTHIFNKLYLRVVQGLKKFVLYYIHNFDDKNAIAEEIISETFCSVLTKIDTYDKTKSKFITWLYTIAKNEIFLTMKEQNKKVSIDKLMHNFNIDSPEIDISKVEMFNRDEYIIDVDNLINNEEAEYQRCLYYRVLEHICRLPLKYKDILIDREMLNMKYKDLADKYNLKINTIRSRIKIGRQLLKDSFVINETEE